MARRRGRGEGSIAQRADGTWQGAVTIGYKDGKRQRKFYFGATRGAVSEKLKVALRDLQQGKPLPNERRTVAQFLDAWLKDVAKPRLRPSTYESYERMIRLHIIPALGRLPLAKLAPQTVQAWLNAQQSSGRVVQPAKEGAAAVEPDQEQAPAVEPMRTLSPRTVQYLRAILRTALRSAEKWGMVARNVAMLTDAPRSQRREIHPLTPDQARAFLVSIAGHRLYAVFAVAIACGLRRGEILGLRWSDVDLDASRLRVEQAMSRDEDGKRVFVEPKSERSRRTIAVPSVIVDALKAHRKGQLEERLVAGGQWRDNGLVFTNRTGGPLDEWKLGDQLHAMLKAAELPRVRFHDLRHSCASFLLAQGVAPRAIMEILGHSQISLTLDTYSHLMPGGHEEAAHKMDQLLRR